MHIKKGTQVFLTEKGCKEFFYPTLEWTITTEDVEGERLTLLGGGTKLPFLIPSKAIGKTKVFRTLVWIEKDAI
jgi:hypothetical protein